jgi:hypothetical protein
MANIFLDTNFLLDVVERQPNKINLLNNHQVYISPLSFHILFYSNKYKVPNLKISKLKDEFFIVDLTESILTHALNGPTSDLEDNIQLHSAAQVLCDYFLTSDQKLLAMKYFGKTRLLPSLINTSD